jgi:hypothetical protein
VMVMVMVVVQVWKEKHKSWSVRLGTWGTSKMPLFAAFPPGKE